MTPTGRHSSVSIPAPKPPRLSWNPRGELGRYAGVLDGRLGHQVVAMLEPAKFPEGERRFNLRSLLPGAVADREMYTCDEGKARAEAVVAQWLRHAGLTL